VVARAAGLDMDVIVSAALRIVDADGLDGLTMRRVSAALGVTAMALYHHVDGKERLLDLVVDQSLTALPMIEDDLRDFFIALHRMLVARPALAQAMAARPLEGPVATAAAERALAALRRSGFNDDQAANTFVSMFSYTLGASLYRISRTPLRATGEFPGVDADRTPAVHRVRRTLAASATDEQRFRRVLDTLLAGEPPH
jgi:AcrR family transcriptional regulator